MSSVSALKSRKIGAFGGAAAGKCVGLCYLICRKRSQTDMKFKQKLSEDDHRYIFRLFLRRNYPWGVHSVLTVAIVAAAVATGGRYGYSSSQANMVLALAGGYLLLSMYLVPKLMEIKTLRGVRRSASFGRTLEYTADDYGVAYAANGREYQLFWKDLARAELVKRGMFLRFGGNRAGMIALASSFASPEEFNEFTALVAKQGKPIVKLRY